MNDRKTFRYGLLSRDGGSETSQIDTKKKKKRGGDTAEDLVPVPKIPSERCNASRQRECVRQRRELNSEITSYERGPRSDGEGTGEREVVPSLASGENTITSQLLRRDNQNTRRVSVPLTHPLPGVRSFTRRRLRERPGLRKQNLDLRSLVPT